MTLTSLLPEAVLADNPTVEVVAPAASIGDLGATLNNVWNMDNQNDVVWRQPNQSGQTVQYELQQAGQGAPTDSYGYVLKGSVPKGSDLASAFYANETYSIPGHIYRYLLYRSYIAPHQPGEGGEQFTNGRLLYTSHWGPDWMGDPFKYRRCSRPYARPTGMCGYGKWCLYYFDLSQDLGFAPGHPNYEACGGNPWDWGKPGASVKAFGLWPHENWAIPIGQPGGGGPSGDSPDYFYLDFMYLTGEIVTTPPSQGSRYTVKWNVVDPDGGLVTSNLYYQEQNELLLPAQSPACNATNLTTAWQPIPGGAMTIALDPLARRIFLPTIVKGVTGGSPTTPFGSGTIGPYNQSFVWELTGPAYTEGKVYYVCVVVEDSSGNKSYGSSLAPVIKVPEFSLLYSVNRE